LLEKRKRGRPRKTAAPVVAKPAKAVKVRVDEDPEFSESLICESIKATTLDHSTFMKGVASLSIEEALSALEESWNINNRYLTETEKKKYLHIQREEALFRRMRTCLNM